MSKFKGSTEKKINVTSEIIFDLRGQENDVWKGEDAGYQHFGLFPHCFLKKL